MLSLGLAARVWLTMSIVAFVAGCSGDGGDGDPAADGMTSKSLTASRNGELVVFLRSKALAAYDLSVASLRAGDAVSPGPAPISAPSEVTAPDLSDAAKAFGSGTTTNQEVGVDEADRVKTDGVTMFSVGRSSAPGGGVRLRADGIAVDPSRAAPPVLAPLGELELVSGEVALGIHLSSESGRVALLSTPRSAVAPPWAVWSMSAYWLDQQTTVTFVDVAMPASLRVTGRLVIDGALVDSRRIGDILYLVTRSAVRLPQPVVPLEDAVIARGRAVVEALSGADLLPTLRVEGGAPQPLVVESDCFVQAGNRSPEVDVITITALRLRSDGRERNARCFAGGSEVVYLSRSTLYLATAGIGLLEAAPGDLAIVEPAPPAVALTFLHKFAVEGLAIDYRGSGSVPGHLGWQSGAYRLGDRGGDLRVITDTGPGWAVGVDGPSASVVASPATLSILREDPVRRELVLIGRLPNSSRPAALGKPGERVFATRFTESRAYLVTFRLTDPLYVLDLADPADPQVLGELVMPGFSNYLFPLTDGMLFGIGRSGDGPGGRVRASLLDVSVPTAPREVAALELGSAGGVAVVDSTPHGIVLQQRETRWRAALAIAAGGVSFGPGVEVPIEPETGVPIAPGMGAPIVVDRALYRLEINPGDGSLNERSPIGASSDPVGGSQAPGSLGDDRAVLIDDQVHYLADGRFVSAWW